MTRADTNGDGVTDDLFLLADKVLDYKSYNENGITETAEGVTKTYYNCTWETCSLRSWLNSDFYSTAFSESEQSAIKETELTNEDTLVGQEKTNGGNDTTDRLFLLSLSEIKNSNYGFGNQQARIAQTTDYFEIQGTESIDGTDWWLRSPGEGSSYAAIVTLNGRIVAGGDKVNFTRGVRPALHVDTGNTIISSSLSSKTVNEIALEKSTWDTVEFGSYNGAKKNSNHRLFAKWRLHKL